MLNWDALMPAPGEADKAETGAASPELGEISPVSHHANLIMGEMEFETGSGLQTDFREISPISPISPGKTAGVEIQGIEEEHAGGGGGQDQLSARGREGDDRVTCGQCLNYTEAGWCRVARPDPDALVVALVGYRPVQLPLRCRGFKPLGDDPDQRAGVERWLGLKG